MEGSIVIRGWILTALCLWLGCGRGGMAPPRGGREAGAELPPTVDVSVEAGPEGSSLDGPLVDVPQGLADSQSTRRLDEGITDALGDNLDLPPVEVNTPPMPCQMDEDCGPGLYCDYSWEQVIWCDSLVFALGTPGGCRPVPCGDAGCPDRPCTRYSDCTKDGKHIGLDCYRPRLGCLPDVRCLVTPPECPAGCVATVDEGGFCWRCLCPACRDPRGG
mgnify:CR=1 FL=1